MLIRFSVENFRSIRDRQEFSFAATVLKDLPESVVHPDGLSVGLLKTAAIYGANASGKSNVLRAFEFVRGAVRDSQRVWAPESEIKVQPFLLDDATDRPSCFEVEFLLDGTRHQYGFKATKRSIVEEWLFAYPANRRQMWFTRDVNKSRRFEFGKNLIGENRTIEGLTRENSLFLSAAAQNNHELLSPVYKWFVDRVRTVAGNREIVLQETLQMCDNENIKKVVGQMLAQVDLGVLEIEVKQKPIEDESVRRILSFVWDTLSESAAGKRLAPPTTLPEISFVHRGMSAPVTFAKEDESAGTIAYLALLGPALSSLAQGDLLLVDELDASLHPLLAIELVKLFNNSQLNAKNGQLLFNTHDTNLLRSDVLRRDQIWFTEKDKAGATHLYPLTDFKPRKAENLQRGYLEGRYGAIPFVGDPLVIEAVTD
jgi:AAA15 family ATPase/GTPase